jgi:hypothetical protein
MALLFQPPAACLTKFGPEAHETTNQILLRKDLERRSGTGTHINEFWWGIGEKGTAESISHLIQHYSATSILFSAIKNQTLPDKPPSHVFVWRKYRPLATYTGLRNIPDHVLITSSILRSDGAMKQSHFALVCKSTGTVARRQEGIFSNSHYKNLKKSGVLGSTRRGQRTTTPLVKWTNQPVSVAECDAIIDFSASFQVPNCVELCDSNRVPISMIVSLNQKIAGGLSVAQWISEVAQIRI